MQKTLIHRTRLGALVAVPVLAVGVGWASLAGDRADRSPAATVETSLVEMEDSCSAAVPKGVVPAKAAAAKDTPPGAACPMAGHPDKASDKASAACQMDPATCEKRMKAGDCPEGMACNSAMGAKASAAPAPGAPKEKAASAAGAGHGPGCPMTRAQ
ncbi:MAG: hypothetical protein HY321_00970 [Armatimonadetes bacterium]|nr:hypothetical protein [Armatimonadota bacterium]